MHRCCFNYFSITTMSEYRISVTALIVRSSDVDVARNILGSF